MMDPRYVGKLLDGAGEESVTLPYPKSNVESREKANETLHGHSEMTKVYGVDTTNPA